jgi:hypothetical protein
VRHRQDFSLRFPDLLDADEASFQTFLQCQAAVEADPKKDWSYREHSLMHNVLATSHHVKTVKTNSCCYTAT